MKKVWPLLSQWIDGIVLDLKMPKVSGYLFATLVDEASLNKNVKILLLSGQSLMAGDCQIKLPNIVSKLTKPFKTEDLKQQVNALLNSVSA